MTENNGVIILPIENILLKKEKLFLFHSEEQDIKYFLETDGTVSHIRTWIDKKPYDRDNFLEGCNHTIKRYEFEVEDAEIIILEKKYQEKTQRQVPAPSASPVETKRLLFSPLWEPIPKKDI